MKRKATIKTQVSFMAAIMLAISCKTEKSGPSPLFENLNSDITNIHFINKITENELTNSFIYEYVYNGAGVAVGDIDNDGLDDIYFTSNLSSNALYLNKGNLKFEDITKNSNTKGKRGWTTGVNMVDINSDGLLDIYICKSGPYEKRSLLENELYINKGFNSSGIPHFEESARSYGLNDASYSIQSAFLDFDLDGDLDMYLMNHNPKSFGAGGTETVSPLGDKFYVNENGKYVNRTAEVGIYSNAISYGLGIGISDLNMDGWPDIYISNDYDERDYLYINQKNGTFKEVIKKATNHISNFSMGNDIADFDNDGFMDIMTLDMVSEDNYGMKTSMASMNPEKFRRNVEKGRHFQYMYNGLQKHSTYIDSTGIPFFSDVAQITGVSNTDWSWGPLLADFDNDGLKDIFITNGIKKDFRNKDFFAEMKLFRKENSDALTNKKKINSLVAKTPKRPHKNYFYKNEGGLNFTNRSMEWFPKNYATFSNGAAYSDLDNDGDLDLVINNVDEEAMILQNNSDTFSSNFISLQFNGPTNNSKGIGAKVIVHYDDEIQVFENYMVRGYQSSIPPKIHIGLGEKSKVDSLIVHWPDGKAQKIIDPKINRSITVDYNEETYPKGKTHESQKKLFIPTNKPLGIAHRENYFDDYGVQLLLPHKMSQFGPALAVGDVNGDKKEDIYFGQSTGETSIIYIQKSNGEFIEHQSFEEDAIYEDVNAKFFDFDNDGDLDLFVTSGGNEFDPNSSNYADRLYENKGGKYKKRMDLLPKDLNISSSIIRTIDFDNDGYMDVFVGGRHKPHDYPTPQTSYLLKNEKGIFKDITKTSAPELIDLGLVTDARWTDFDSDGDMDISVVGEWMAPTFFENNDNTFKKIVSKPLDSLTGWYFSITPLDIDEDGDDDYLLGNLGENYKYKASKDEPFEVYYSDFDDNGKKDLVLGYYNFGELFPVRGRECSSQQMPSIKKITPTYDQFGKSTLMDIYGVGKLKNALHLSSYNFKSGILKNNGNGNFDFMGFPDIAQISSINDILLQDLNKDGLKDLIIAGNIFVSEIETPRNDAGYGMVLLNKGMGEFSYLNAEKSGLFLPNDVKVLTTITINGNPHILVGNNNDRLGIFKIRSN
ncbi:VCBS repeat-containing protein [Maribacter sp. 2304DJ31-5]|uniref:VCBS repeat-containing protein n=1 Tax=Maribacter sp. 2304DJ31-5 TaxID=3386273 RepID=UPI0039BD2E1C